MGKPRGMSKSVRFINDMAAVVALTGL